jgi:hypothetical protein
LLANCGIAAGGFVLLATIPDIGDRWRLVAAALFIAAVPLAIISVCLHRNREALKLADTMTDRRVIVRVDPDTITFQTSRENSTVKWSSIRELWKFPDVLLLFTDDKRPTYSILPVEALSDDLRRFIQDRVRDHGGDVA